MKKRYWILNGTSTTYELREEIKNHGGKWDANHKCWSITVSKEDDAYRILKTIGLKLQYRQ